MARGITTPNRVDVSISPVSGSGANAWFNIKQTMVTAGWVVTSSSDGTTYNATGDQISSGGSGAGGLGNVNAWFAIRNSASTIFFTYQTISLSTATNTARVKYAKAAFTGGSPSATQTPTASGEFVARGGGTDAAPTGQRIWSDGTAGTHRLIGNVDGSAPYGFWFMHVRTDSVTDKGEAHFILDPLYVSGDIDHSTDTDKYVLHVVGTTATSLTQTFKAGGSFVLGTTEPGWGRDHTGAYTSCALMAYATQAGTATLYGGTTGIQDQWTGKNCLFPCFYHNTVSGFKGSSSLFWVTGDPDLTNITKTLELFTTQTAAAVLIETREFIRACRYALPWGGAVPSSGSWTTQNTNVMQHIAAAVPATADTTAPVIGSFVPATGSTIDFDDTVQFDVTDNLDDLQRIVISAVGSSGQEETVYNGSAFTANYSAGSTNTAIANGRRFVLARAGDGWLTTSLTLRIIAMDDDGNEGTPLTYSYTVTPAVLVPVISGFVPATGSTIDFDDTVQFDVTDNNSLLSRVVISAVGSSGQEELVHDGTAFKTNYSAGSTRTAISGGFRYVLARSGDGWLTTALTVRVIAYDTQGYEATPTTYSWVVNPDVLLPQVTNFVPAVASALTATQAVQFDVLDNNNSFAAIKVSAFHGAGLAEEVIHDGTTFMDPYVGGSNARTVITDGYRYVVQRQSGGWPTTSLTLKIVAIDTQGNVSTPTTFTFTPTPAAGDPVITNLSPPEGELPGKDTPIEFDLTDATPGLLLVMILIKFAGRSRKQLIHDNASFDPLFIDRSSRTAITNGYHYSILPAGGWLDDIEKIEVFAIDQIGNYEGSLP